MNKLIPFIPIFIMLGLAAIALLFSVDKARKIPKSKNTPSHAFLYSVVALIWGIFVATVVMATIKMNEKALAIYLIVSGGVLLVCSFVLMYLYSEYKKVSSGSHKNTDAKSVASFNMVAGILTLMTSCGMIGIGIWMLKHRKVTVSGVSSASSSNITDMAKKLRFSSPVVTETVQAPVTTQFTPATAPRPNRLTATPTYRPPTQFGQL